MYYVCTKDLWSMVIPNLKKFDKDGVYLCVSPDTYINNQGNVDDIKYERWQKYFKPFKLDNVNIEELNELLLIKEYDK